MPTKAAVDWMNSLRVKALKLSVDPLLKYLLKCHSLQPFELADGCGVSSVSTLLIRFKTHSFQNHPVANLPLGCGLPIAKYHRSLKELDQSTTACVDRSYEEGLPQELNEAIRFAAAAVNFSNEFERRSEGRSAGCMTM